MDETYLNFKGTVELLQVTVIQPPASCFTPAVFADELYFPFSANPDMPVIFANEATDARGAAAEIAPVFAVLLDPP